MKWTTEITNKGAELIAQAVASGDMVFTKAVGSSTLSGAADLKTVTEVSQPQYELKLKSIEAAGNSTRLTVRLLNDGVDEAYTIRQVGIYGKLKDDTEETLISISENSVGETVPSTTTIPEWVCDLAIVLNMDNTIKPTINIPSGVYALKTDIPTTLPANGGNADTVDGLHETSFPHNRGDISDCDNAVLPGTYNATPETINTPYSAYWLVSVEIGASGTWVRQTATICDISKPNKTYCRLFINDNWSDSWIKINDGGNADTLDGLHANEIASNPNLLINPDFRINQRGQMEYSGDTNYIYTVDCWRVGFGDGTAKSLKVESDGIVFGSSTDRQYLVQTIETPERLIGDYTLTFCVSEITGSAVIQFVDGDAVSSSTAISEPGGYSVTRTLSGTGTTGAIRLQLRSEAGATVKVRWAKLELGSIATPFVPPDPATELLKIQSMNDDGTPKLISNSTLPTIMNSQMVSNPNLLINPDFRINQRGFSEYTSGYTVDRWSLDPGKASVSVGTDGLCITSAVDLTSNTHVLWQRLEFPLPPGKYTLSVNVKGEVTGFWAGRIRTVTADGTYVDSYYTPILRTGVNKVSVDLSENEYISAVSISFNNGTKIGDSIKLEWIKLEPGSNITPFMPPDPATELVKCQRYFYRLQSRSSGNTLCLVAIPAPSNKNYSNSQIFLPVCMRLSPTVTIAGTLKVLDSSNTSLTISDSSVSPLDTNCNIFNLNVTTSTATTDAAVIHELGLNSYIDFSAEL